MPDQGSKTAIYNKLWFWYGIALFVVLLDQATKYWAFISFDEYQRVNVLPVFDFTLVYNKGAAWSFLANAGGWQRWFFVLISTVVSIVLLIWISRLKPEKKWLLIALSLVLGGALGNLIDRIYLGKVIDFLLFYYNDNYFPAFNIADSAITVGAGFMLLDMFFGENNSEH